MSLAVYELGKALGAIRRQDDSAEANDEYDDDVDFYLVMKLDEEIGLGVLSVIRDMKEYGIPMSWTVEAIANRYKNSVLYV